MDLSEDSLRVYPIHRDAEQNIIIIGVSELINDEEFYII